MKNLIIACLMGTAWVAVTACSSDREQPVSSTTTTEESTVMTHPVESTTTDTTVQKN